MISAAMGYTSRNDATGWRRAAEWPTFDEALEYCQRMIAEGKAEEWVRGLLIP